MEGEHDRFSLLFFTNKRSNAQMKCQPHALDSNSPPATHAVESSRQGHAGDRQALRCSHHMLAADFVPLRSTGCRGWGSRAAHGVR